MERPMKKICVLMIMIVFATASLSAQAVPKKAGAQSRYINLPKPVQAPFSDAIAGSIPSRSCRKMSGARSAP